MSVCPVPDRMNLMNQKHIPCAVVPLQGRYSKLTCSIFDGKVQNLAFYNDL